MDSIHQPSQLGGLPQERVSDRGDQRHASLNLVNDLRALLIASAIGCFPVRADVDHVHVGEDVTPPQDIPDASGAKA